MEKTKEYEGDGITVIWNARRCIHAAECVRGLPDVFDPKARPWISPAGMDADALAQVIERCPTGALSYRRTDGGPQEAVAPTPSIELVEDGPLLVRGDVTLVRPEGGEIPGPPRAALCRCGQSKNKPFCDNSHIEAGFRSGE